MECRDSAKPLRDAYWEVDCAARNFEFYGAAADKLFGISIPLGDSSRKAAAGNEARREAAG